MNYVSTGLHIYFVCHSGKWNAHPVCLKLGVQGRLCAPQQPPVLARLTATASRALAAVSGRRSGGGNV